MEIRKIPAGADLRDYIGRDIHVTPDGMRLTRPVKANIQSNVDRMLVMDKNGRLRVPRCKS